MIIQLGEHDGMMYEDGVPRLIVVNVTTDDGRKFSFPHAADAQIRDLYEKVNRVPKTAHTPVQPIPQPPVRVEVSAAPANSGSSIERNDIVRYTGEDSDDGDIKKNDEVRVIDIQKRNDKVVAYAVVNDNHPTPIRITLLPQDVVLVRKGKKPPVKRSVLNYSSTCDACGEEVILEAVGESLQGQCEMPGCGKVIVKERASV